MKLNRVEKALMNNPVRALVQRRYEAVLMERLGKRIEGQRVLEIGCGRGVGTEIIFERFGAREVDAFDLDPDMIAQAQRRLSAYSSDRLRLFVGGAAAMRRTLHMTRCSTLASSTTYPIGNRRLRKSATCFDLADFFSLKKLRNKLSNRWFYRVFLEHPTESRFTRKEFVIELERQAISVGSNQVEWFLGDFVVGVGHRRHH
jgi:SAM-dependent methyltransferase